MLCLIIIYAHSMETIPSCNNTLDVEMALAIFQCFPKDTRIASLIALATFQPFIALASISKMYQRLELVGDGVAHFEGPVWDVVEELVGQIDWVGSSDLHIMSSVPPEGYHYLQLFVPERRNWILQFL